MVVDFEAELTYPQERELLTKFGTLNANVQSATFAGIRIARVARRVACLGNSGPAILAAKWLLPLNANQLQRGQPNTVIGNPS